MMVAKRIDYFKTIYLFKLGHVGSLDTACDQGLKPPPHTQLAAWSPSHWTTREVRRRDFFLSLFFFLLCNSACGILVPWPGTWSPCGGSRVLTTEPPGKTLVVDPEHCLNKKKTKNCHCVVMEVKLDLQWWSFHNIYKYWMSVYIRNKCNVVCQFSQLIINGGFPGSSIGKESACSAKDPGSIPGSGRSPGEGNSNPLQDSCLENPMNRGAWWATVHGVTRVRTI